MNSDLLKSEYVQKATLFDDLFFAVCLDNQPLCLQQILDPCFSYLSEQSIKIESVKTQEQITSITGKSVRLDALAIDKNGNRADIEIQRVSGKGLRKRARFYSSLLDGSALNAGDDYESLPDTYVIFITEDDFLGLKQPLCKIERKICFNNFSFEDGSHILFLNGSYKGNDAMGRLIHDLKCPDPCKMYNEVLAERVRQFKGTDEGVKTMAGIEEKIAMRAMAEGEARGEARGRSEGKAEIAAKLIQLGQMSLDMIAEISGIPLEELKKMKESIPDPA